MTVTRRTMLAAGLAAPFIAKGARAETVVRFIVSNCPQVNNPCNGFQPTPVQVQIFPA